MSGRKIIFVAAECAPLIKVGGLADVVGALPIALRQAGEDVSVWLPHYPGIDWSAAKLGPPVAEFPVPWLGGSADVRVCRGRLPNSDVPLFTLNGPGLGPDHELYPRGNDPEELRRSLQRFTFFSWATAHALARPEFRPAVVHVHDWHASGVVPFLKILGQSLPTILTIHNLSVQGAWSADELFSWPGLNDAARAILRSRDHRGDFNFMQQGIQYADSVTTVSPTYAKEILTGRFGEGLEADLAARSQPVTGILNGIDVSVFNPASDQHLAVRYDAASVAAGKIQNRRALEKEFGWTEFSQPLFVSVGRLTNQKGYQYLLPLIPWLVSGGARLAILGSGAPDLEAAAVAAAKESPARVRVVTGFDGPLAQRLYAAGDFFLMPSVFEPCGLGQMIAMRYGTLPIVRATGGLRDTVTDLTIDPERGTGFVFNEASEAALQAAIHRALVLDHESVAAARVRAMKQDFSWTRPSQDYQKLYDRLAPK